MIEQLRLGFRQRSIWTVTVNLKSSAAKWYIPGITDVLNLLHTLAEENSYS